MSQYDLRALVSPDQKAESSQLLVSDEEDALPGNWGRKDLTAAEIMGLGIESYDALANGEDATEWLTWMKSHTDVGHPVMRYSSSRREYGYLRPHC